MEMSGKNGRANVRNVCGTGQYQDSLGRLHVSGTEYRETMVGSSVRKCFYHIGRDTLARTELGVE